MTLCGDGVATGQGGPVRLAWAARAFIGPMMLVIGTLGVYAVSADGSGLEEAGATDRTCLAQAMYWEARAEGRDGMRAVGWVVLNRVADRRFPNTVCDVVRQGGEEPGCQFSFWCDGQSDVPRAQAPWAMAQDVAAGLLSDPKVDPTHGALFFHAASLQRVPWSVPREETARIGNHVYYR